MTKQKGLIEPNLGDPDAFFIGWAKAPAVDRRFLIGALPALTAAVAGGAYATASNLSDPGTGAWLTDATHTVDGYLLRDPYPMLVSPDASAPSGMRTTLIVAEGKCTSGLKLDERNGAWVSAAGVLIERRNRQMLEVPLLLDNWLTETSAPDGAAARYQAPTPEPLGEASLRGMVMDSKCFFGVMRPARGRTHKACASLCIRGGIPPSFWARTEDGREAVLLMTDDEGGPISDAILPIVADAVEVTGQLVRVGDIVQLRANADRFKRI